MDFDRFLLPADQPDSLGGKIHQERYASGADHLSLTPWQGIDPKVSGLAGPMRPGPEHGLRSIKKHQT